MKKYKLVKMIVYVLLSILLFIFKAYIVEHLRYYIGALMIMYGIDEIIHLLLHKEKLLEETKFFFSIVEILLGSVMIILINSFETICIIWAVWSILRESFELEEIFDHKLNIVLAIITALESIAVIYLSIELILTPTHHHAMIHIYLLSIELILNSTLPLINHLIKKRIIN